MSAVMQLADICGGNNGCTIGDGLAVLGIALAVAIVFGIMMWRD